MVAPASAAATARPIRVPRGRLGRPELNCGPRDFACVHASDNSPGQLVANTSQTPRAAAGALIGSSFERSPLVNDRSTRICRGVVPRTFSRNAPVHHPARTAAARVPAQNGANSPRQRCKAAGAPARRWRYAPSGGWRGSSGTPGSKSRPQCASSRRICSLGLAHHVLVLHVQHLARQHGLPVVHKRQIAAVVASQIIEAVAEGLARGEMLLEGAEAGVHRMATGVDDGGVRQDRLDEADVAEIVG